MDNTLFICNTVYQIVIAIQLKLTIFRNERSYLIITDTVNNSSDIAMRIKKEGVFNFVYSVTINSENFKFL